MWTAAGRALGVDSVHVPSARSFLLSIVARRIGRKKRKPSSKLWAENYGFIFCLPIHRIAIQMSWSGSI
jgi:hypothetical protein